MAICPDVPELAAIRSALGGLLPLEPSGCSERTGRGAAAASERSPLLRGTSGFSRGQHMAAAPPPAHSCVTGAVNMADTVGMGSLSEHARGLHGVPAQCAPDAAPSANEFAMRRNMIQCTARRRHVALPLTWLPKLKFPAATSCACTASLFHGLSSLARSGRHGAQRSWCRPQPGSRSRAHFRNLLFRQPEHCVSPLRMPLIEALLWWSE